MTGLSARIKEVKIGDYVQGNKYGGTNVLIQGVFVEDHMDIHGLVTVEGKLGRLLCRKSSLVYIHDEEIVQDKDWATKTKLHEIRSKIKRK